MAERERVVQVLLERFGRRYAEDAGIRLADKPGPLYQLLVLATLLSARISADIAVAAARELFAAGYRTPQAMMRASWQDRVDALDRGQYRRYDERTATMLGDGAALLIDRWHGDLRRLRDEADGAGRAEGAGQADGVGRAEGGGRKIASLLISFPGIGPTGADIFLREVQDVWPSLAPYVDTLMLKGARRVGLPDDRDTVAGVLAATGEPARLAAALVRVALSDRAAGDVIAASAAHSQQR
jgi:endonuclease III